MSEYEDKNISHCPFCGGELKTDNRDLSPLHKCSECETEMRMEVWGYTPDFWHRE